MENLQNLIDELKKVNNTELFKGMLGGIIETDIEKCQKCNKCV